MSEYYYVRKSSRKIVRCISEIVSIQAFHKYQDREDSGKFSALKKPLVGKYSDVYHVFWTFMEVEEACVGQMISM